MSDPKTSGSFHAYCQSTQMTLYTTEHALCPNNVRYTQQCVHMLWHSLFSGWYTSWILTHWGRVKHICVSKATIIGTYNGLSLDRQQAIIWIDAGIYWIGPLATYFSEILIEFFILSLRIMQLTMSSGKCRHLVAALNMLMPCDLFAYIIEVD